MFTQIRSKLLSLILAPILVVGGAQRVRAIDTYTYSTTTTGTAWLNSANWTGGVANHFPGDTNNPSVTAEGLSTDIMTFTTGAFTGSNISINMNINANTGIGNNAAANGLLSLGTINFQGTKSGLASNTLLIGKSDSAMANTNLRLNGGTIDPGSGSISNVLISISNNATNNLTITNTAGGTGLMNLQLGITNGVIYVNSGRTLTVTSAITEVTSGSGFEKQGAGTMVINTAGTFTGTLSLKEGVVSIGTVAQMGNGQVSFNGGALRTTNTSSITSAAARGFTINSGGGTFDIFGNGATSAGTLTIDGSISGDGNITKNGLNVVNTSVLNLTANNSDPTTGFGGKYTINAGELLAATDASFGKVPGVPVADYFTLNGGLLRSNNGTVTINSNRGITLGANGGGFDTATATVHTLSYDGVIAGGVGTGGLTKHGPQTLSLGGANTYSGGTVINSGAIYANNTSGSATGTGAVDVVGGTLAGSGAVSGPVNVQSGGTLAPGASVGTLGMGNNLDLDGTLSVEYDDTLSPQKIDIAVVAGNLDITAGTLTFADISLGTVGLSQSAYVFAIYGTLTGTAFQTVNNLPAGYTIDYAYNDGMATNHIALILSAVPEASSFLFGGLACAAAGMGAVVARRRRQRNQAG